MIFHVHPYPGKWIQFDEHIFQMGWNHQLDKHWHVDDDFDISKKISGPQTWRGNAVPSEGISWWKWILPATAEETLWFMYDSVVCLTWAILYWKEYVTLHATSSIWKRGILFSSIQYMCICIEYYWRKNTLQQISICSLSHTDKVWLVGHWAPAHLLH